MQEKIELLRSAIRELKQVTGTCNGYPREFCPHVLGQKGAKWSVLVWQFAGLSESSLRPDGDWRCFELDDLEHLAKRDGDWHRGWSTGQREQSCVDLIDTTVDINHAAEIRETSREHTRWPAVRRRDRRRW